MSLYANYLHECGHSAIIESEHGFMTYRVLGPECYIVDVYVEPKYRRTHLCFDMADKVAEIARKRGCTLLTGSVNLQIKDPTASMQMLLAYGFKILKCDPSIIWVGKKLCQE